MGRVSTAPITAETRSPMTKGRISVAHMIKLPITVPIFPMGGAMSIAASTPVRIVTAGVTIKSTGVRLETSLPKKMDTMLTKKTDRGPPLPPSAFAA